MDIEVGYYISSSLFQFWHQCMFFIFSSLSCVVSLPIFSLSSKWSAWERRMCENFCTFCVGFVGFHLWSALLALLTLKHIRMVHAYQTRATSTLHARTRAARSEAFLAKLLPKLPHARARTHIRTYVRMYVCGTYTYGTIIYRISRCPVPPMYKSRKTHS